MNEQKNVTPAEAVFGFVKWIASGEGLRRKQKLYTGDSKGIKHAAKLFCEANGFERIDGDINFVEPDCAVGGRTKPEDITYFKD